MHKIFIDGQAGTTGLQIHERLQDRADLELLCISDADRKNIDVKRQIIDEADVVILCLPDKAAIETVQLAPLGKARFIDASTAHRTNKDWVYGLPEMDDTQRSLIQSAHQVSNPGCYPTGFLLPVIPFIEQAWLKPSSPISCSAISGYSCGGRKQVAAYEQQAREKPGDMWHSRLYSLQLAHKHIGEMQHFAKLDTAPIFLPSVGHFAQGMLVSIALFDDFFFSEVNPDQVYELLPLPTVMNPVSMYSARMMNRNWRTVSWIHRLEMVQIPWTFLCLGMRNKSCWFAVCTTLVKGTVVLPFKTST